jgi:hypothetical protein
MARLFESTKFISHEALADVLGYLPIPIAAPSLFLSKKVVIVALSANLLTSICSLFGSALSSLSLAALAQDATDDDAMRTPAVADPAALAMSPPALAKALEGSGADCFALVHAHNTRTFDVIFLWLTLGTSGRHAGVQPHAPGPGRILSTCTTRISRFLYSPRKCLIGRLVALVSWRSCGTAQWATSRV